jgi:hypothetical protein
LESQGRQMLQRMTMSQKLVCGNHDLEGHWQSWKMVSLECRSE